MVKPGFISRREAMETGQRGTTFKSQKITSFTNKGGKREKSVARGLEYVSMGRSHNRTGGCDKGRRDDEKTLPEKSTGEAKD